MFLVVAVVVVLVVLVVIVVVVAVVVVVGVAPGTQHPARAPATKIGATAHLTLTDSARTLQSTL